MKIAEHNLAEYCPEEFRECEIIFDDEWSDYEEWGFVIVFDLFGEMFEWSYEYCVFADDNRIFFEPRSITDEQLVILKEQWANRGNY